MAPKKRKHDSSSPDAKDTSRPSDWMPVVQQILDVLGSIRDELRGIAQVKSTVEVLADKFPKLDENVENILNKIKQDLKEEIKEVVKFEMLGNVGKSDGVQLDNKQNQSKVVCDDYAKAPEYSHASPSLRSQPHHSQPPRFRLQINSTMSNVSYKGRPVQTNDERDIIEVEMRDGDKPIAHDHPLASVKVNLVLVDDEKFNKISTKLWSVDDFKETLWNPENTKLLKNGTFKLNGGRAIQPKVIITQGTIRKDIRLGVMAEELGLGRVLEGLSNPFKVQEAKTAKTATNGTGKVCIPLGQAPCRNDQQYLPRQILSQPMQHDSREHEGSATHRTTKDLPRHTGESLQQPLCKIEDTHQECLSHFYDAQSSHPQVIIQSSSYLASTPTEGNGHGRINGQQYYQQTMMPQRFAVPNRSSIVQYVAGNNPISRPQQQYTNPRATTQQHHHGQGQVISSQCHNLLPNSLPAINAQIVGNGRGGPFVLHRSEQQTDTTYQQGNNDNFQVGQRQILPDLSSTEAVKHAVQGQLNSHQHHNFQHKSLFSATHAHPIMAGQGQLNSHQHQSARQKSLFPAMHAQPMDLDIRLNSTQNMPYSSISQINAAQRNSWSLPHTKMGENGQAENSQQQFQHGQPEILLETGKDEVISGGQGQVVSTMHNILPPSTFLAINAQSVGQEENFQQVQRQILPQHTSTEVVKHGSQGQLNSQNLLRTMPAQAMDLDIRLNSSQNMPYSSTSQINDPHRDSWSLPHTQIGENGQAENSQLQFQHGQPQILPESRKDEVISGGQGQVVSSPHDILPPSSLPDINTQCVEGKKIQQVQRQFMPQHTSTEAVKHAGQGQLNSQNLLSAMPVRTMDQDIMFNSSQSIPYSSTSQNNVPQGDSWSLPHTHIGGNGQEDNFQQVQRQILLQHTSTEAVKHAGQGQLNSQNILPAMPPETMDLATRLNSSQNRPYGLDVSASQVNPPQNSSQLPINNSSGPTEENYGSSLPTCLGSLVFTPKYYFGCNENQELFMADSCAGERTT